MAFLPFIPLVIGAALGSARGIIANRQARKKYDQQAAIFNKQWAEQEAARVRRAQIIQRIIQNDPKLQEASSILGPDFWDRVMTTRPVPKEYFPDRPRGGILGDFVSGHLGGLQGLAGNPGGIESAFNEMRRQNGFPNSAEIAGAESEHVDGGGGQGFPTVKPINFDTGEDEIVYGTPNRSSGGYGSNVPPQPSAPVTSSQAKPTGSQYSPPPVLSGMGLRFNPVTGQVENKFGATVEF